MLSHKYLFKTLILLLGCFGYTTVYKKKPHLHSRKLQHRSHSNSLSNGPRTEEPTAREQSALIGVNPKPEWLDKPLNLTSQARPRAANRARQEGGGGTGKPRSATCCIKIVFSQLGVNCTKHSHVSYGDSTNESPSEQGVVSDSLFVLSWTMERVKGAPLFVWGHSLGTGVSSHSLDILSQKGIHPTGLILEAPFNNMRDEIREHPLARVFRFLPWFDFCFADSVGENNLLFETDKHLRNVRSRILILHAEDDKVIPFKLAKKLYESTVQGRSPHFGKVKFVKFEGKWGHGHKWICRSPDLPNVIRQFVAED
uniref:Uncharacterized protein n=1 Tax=Timema poppense TaxID=170557 RepID=A0A7R9DAY8_TIMPO|nr:unnamed protein product [Timema poppensis]